MPNHSDMPYRRLGRCGLKVSALSLGGWTTYGGSVQESNSIRQILTKAFESGVNFFDSADVYERGACEVAMGSVLRDLPRNEIVVSSKVFWPMSDDVNDRGLSRKHILESCNRSLKRLGMDYMDLYFCHRFDPEVPLEETVRALDDLVRAGKILHWGTSEWTGDQLRRAKEISSRTGGYGPSVEQPQYHLLCRSKVETDVAPTAVELGLGLVTWSPLASGLLTGKYDNGIPEGSRLSRLEWLRDSVYQEERIAKVRKFGELAKTWGISRSRLALAWVREGVGISSVITGATSLEQLDENLSSLSVNLTSDQKAALENLFPQ